MESEQRRLEALENASLLSKPEEARLAQLRAGAVSVSSPAPIAIPVVTVGGDDTGEIVTIQITDVRKFNESAQYGITREGYFRSILVRTIRPNTDKPQMWFVLETADKMVDPPNRGVFVGEFGAGSGILRTLLDSLEIAYKLDETTGMLSIRMPKLPLVCYADWSKDMKSIGGVRISGLKTEKIGSQVTKVI